MADPGGVDADDPVDPLLPGVDMPAPPDAPADEPLRRDRLRPVVVLVEPVPIGIEPMVLPGVEPMVEPVPIVPLPPGAVEALPVLVEVPVEPAPADPGAAPPAGAVWAAAAVARMAALKAINVFIIVSLGEALTGAVDWSSVSCSTRRSSPAGPAGH